MDSNGYAISLANISKCFKTYKKPSDRLIELFIPNLVKTSTFWSLKDINLNIKKGSTVGIIGRNGSGKSTLLRIIANTLTPTTGTAEVQGRIAALLELGSGFNPEFTGRQNVFFNGRILGIEQTKLELLFESIEKFADIGSFIDRPVKTYSSGMSVRLAFAVATAVTPDILIVDEALSVGDEAFQRKCFARIKDIQSSGSTVLFVSHSASSIIELCDSAVLLDGGEILLESYPKLVVSEYQKLAYAPPKDLVALRGRIRAMNQRIHESSEQNRETTKPLALASAAQKNAQGCANVNTNIAHENNSKPLVQGIVLKERPRNSCPQDNADFDPNLLPKSTITYVSRGASIESPYICTVNERRVNLLVSGEEYLYRYRVYFEKDSENVRYGMLIKTIRGFELGGAVSHTRSDPLKFIKKGTSVEVEFRFQCLLQPGAYFLNAGVVGQVDKTEVFLAREIDTAMFRVKPIEGLKTTGIVSLCSCSGIKSISTA